MHIAVARLAKWDEILWVVVSKVPSTVDVMNLQISF